MQKMKVLVALDASENSRRAIDYCANAMKGMSAQCNGNVCIKLFFVEQLPIQSTFASRDAWQEECRSNREEQMLALKNAVASLVEQGVTESCIESEYVSRNDSGSLEDADHRADVAKRILEEQRSGKYGTLVMGKRGVSKAQAYLFGSVTQRVLEGVKDCVVWLVC